MRTVMLTLVLMACGTDNPDDPVDDDGEVDPQAPTDADRPLANCIADVAHDNDGDGEPDIFFEYVYDANERLSSWTQTNGPSTLRFEFTYDEDGNVLTRTQNDEVFQTYVRDEDGDVTHIEVDLDGDDAIDVLHTMSYDNAKRLVREEVDEGVDDTIDDLHTHVWTDNGDGTVSDERSSDLGNDGSVDSVTERVTDSEDRLLDLWTDSDANELWDSHEGYTLDEDGARAVRLVEFFGDDGTTVTGTYTWNYTRDEWARIDFIDMHTEVSGQDFWAVQEHTYTCE